MAFFNSYPFFYLLYSGRNVAFDKPIQVGSVPGHNCSQLTMCIDVKRRRSCADQRV